MLGFDSLFFLTFLDDGSITNEESINQDDGLHITFLAHIQVPSDAKNTLEQFLKDAGNLLRSFDSFTLTLGEEAYYGINHDFQVVTIIDEELNAHQLHDALYNLVKSYGFKLGQPHYTRENFAPHITQTVNSDLKLGDKFEVKNVSVSMHYGGIVGFNEGVTLATYDLG